MLTALLTSMTFAPYKAVMAELFESRFLLMEAKEKSNCSNNAQLQAQLVTTYDCAK